VSANYGKLDQLQREKVWEMKQGGYTAAEIARRLAAGFANSDPPIAKVDVSAQAVRALIKAQDEDRAAIERFAMARVPTQADVQTLRDRVLRIARRECERIADRQNRGRINPNEIRDLARMVGAVEAMETAAQKRSRARPPAPSKPAGDAGSTESDRAEPTFADGLLERAQRSGSDESAAPLPAPPLSVP
jgi:hypothetical protein